MRLIDADALLKILEQHYKDCENAYKKTNGEAWHYMQMAYQRAINEVLAQQIISKE